jgi:hypothetical protein
MTAEEIRESSAKLVEKWVAIGKDLQPAAVQSGIYAALVEIAAQLADLNEQIGKGRLLPIFTAKFTEPHR